MNFNNFFDLLHITPCIFVDIKKLDYAYQNLQQLFHPDQQNNALDSQAAIVLSSKIAKAYATLKNPLLCVDHLLYLKNCPTLNQQGNSITDSDILEENMAFQEQLLSSPYDVSILMQDIELKIKVTVEKLERAYEINDIDTLQKQALYFFYRFQFLQKLKNI
jgi:Fe-S protein assembly co-chaperone HscB